MTLPQALRLPTSTNAQKALDAVLHLQAQLAKHLPALDESDIKPISWLRDEGSHGGGLRLSIPPNDHYNRGSINVSCVHYDDLLDKKLGSANALSTIIHPSHPLAPSMHCHISWTEMKDGTGYWRMMADLNPSIPNDEHTKRFVESMREACGVYADYSEEQGQKYFFIPALNRHRGVAHYYFEGFNSGDFAADLAFATGFGEALIRIYTDLLKETFQDAPTPTNEQRSSQLAYHTAYLFQVLTLDRGTTSGLLVHDQNDVGILASLPTFVDRELLASWLVHMPTPQDKLLQGIIDILPESTPSEVSDFTRAKLAEFVRGHYRHYPEALTMQASADIIPPTIQNHTA
jgi:coproporphyrinogen III oxidase